MSRKILLSYAPVIQRNFTPSTVNRGVSFYPNFSPLNIHLF